MKRFFSQYFGLIALFFIGASTLAGAIIRRSLASGLLAGLAAVAAIIVFFIFLGLAGAASERLEELRGRARASGKSLALALAREWALGLIFWIPPQPMLTQFLLVWAMVGVAVVMMLPKFAAWSLPVRSGAAAALVLAAGLINGAFHRD